MKNNQIFKLVDGQFNASEAKSILFTLINSKINFHSLESFGITVRSNGDVSLHEKRVKELRETNSSVKETLDFAEKNKMKVKINSMIEIKLINGRKKSSKKV